MTINISKMDFTDLLKYEDVLKQLSPEKQLEDLDTYFIVFPEKILLVIKESDSVVKVDIPFAESDIQKGSVFPAGLLINSSRFFHTLSSYGTDELKEMQIDIRIEDTSFFKVIMPHDRLSLSHLVVSIEDISDVLNMIENIYPKGDIASFDLSLFNDDKEDFFKGLKEGLTLISDNDLKNNAFALYNDKMIVNYNRHIFIHYYPNPVLFLSDTVPVSLHKRIAKFMLTMTGKKREFQAKLDSEERKIYITSDSFLAILNNSMSNNNPPSQADMETYKTPSLVAKIRVGEFRAATNFINGYYSQGGDADYNTIMLNIGAAGINFILKDSGVAQFSTCQVERLMTWNDTSCVLYDNPELEVMVVIDSLISYLRCLEEDEVVDLRVDMVPEHKAVYIHHPNRDIYLAKIGG